MSPRYDPNNPDWWKGDSGHVNPDTKLRYAIMTVFVVGTGLVLGGSAMSLGWARLMQIIGVACVAWGAWVVRKTYPRSEENEEDFYG